MMVAIRGTGWHLAPALVRLMDETDRLFPGRNKASDGSIGDAAHAARTSDHNPSGGWVDAVDITDDDARGCDVGLLAHHLVASRDRRVSYLIHKGTIWRGYAKPGLPAFTPQTYTGINAHRQHLHVSIADAHRASTAAWWPQATTPPAAPEARMIFHIENSPYTFLMKDAGLCPLSEDEFWLLAGVGVPVKTIPDAQFGKLNRQLKALAKRPLQPT